MQLVDVSTTRKFICELCGVKIKDPKALDSHIQRIHTSNTRNQQKCQQCDYKSLAKGRIKMHTKRMHSDQRNYKCDFCKKTCNSSSSLATHKLVHSDPDSWFKCQQFEYTTPYKGKLSRHMVSHTSERNFKCDICPQDYQTPRGLAYHKRVVHEADAKQFSCDKCDYKTSWKEKFTIAFTRM